MSCYVCGRDVPTSKWKAYEATIDACQSCMRYEAHRLRLWMLAPVVLIGGGVVVLMLTGQVTIP